MNKLGINSIISKYFTNSFIQKFVRKLRPALLHQSVTKNLIRIYQFGCLLFWISCNLKKKSRNIGKQIGQFVFGFWSPTDVMKRALVPLTLDICLPRGTSINDVPCFLAIFYLPTLSYYIMSDFWGYLGPPYLSTLIWDVINERSHSKK